MAHCYCENCAAVPLPTYTRQYRAACEVRWVASLPRAARFDYLERIAYRRGLAAAVAMRQAIATLPTPQGQG